MYGLMHRLVTYQLQLIILTNGSSGGKTQTRYRTSNTDKSINIRWMSEWLLFNTNSKKFRLYHGESKLIKSPKQLLETYCFCSVSYYYYYSPLSLSFFLSFHGTWTCPRQISGTTGQNFMKLGGVIDICF